MPDPSRPGLLALTAVRPDLLGEVGGKAVGLARLMAWGHRVPAGLVIPVSAFRGALAAAGREAELEAMVEAAVRTGGAGLAAAAAGLQTLVRALPVPGDLRLALGTTCPGLGSRLALRSSAACEDLPEASFAGQHESFLELAGPEAVLACIPEAWASFYSARALTYRARLGFAREPIAPALVVQAMVEARVAGVLFSRDPRGGRNRLLTAAWGLGEGVVSGAVEPDTWELDPETGEVRAFRPGAKASRVVPAPGGRGTARVPTPEAGRTAACLEPEALAELARVARDLEAAAGRAQDIEWAYGPDGLVLLQTRDATRGPGTVPPPPLRMAPVHVYVCGNLAETMGQPTRTLGLSLLQWMMDGALDLPVIRSLPKAMRQIVRIFGRPYTDATWAFLWPSLGRQATLPLEGIDTHSARALRGLFDRGEIQARWPLGFGATLRYLAAAGWETLRFLPHLAWSQLRPRQAWEGFVRDADRAVEALACLRQEGGSAGSRLARIDSAFPTLTAGAMRKVMGPLVTVMTRLSRLAALITASLGPDGAASIAFDVATPPEGSWTEKMASALARLVAIGGAAPAVRARLAGPEPGSALADLRREPSAGGFLRELDAFLAQFGHRGPGEQDLGAPRWADDPAMLVPILAGQLGGPDAEARRATAARDREARLVGLLAEVRARHPGPAGEAQARRIATQVARTREVLAIREDAKHHCMRIVYELRLAYLEAGGELAARGALDRAEDVVELERDEVLAALRGEPTPVPLARLARRRRADRLRLAAVAAPIVVLESGRELSAEARFEEAAGGRLLRGEPASPGVLEGRVRVLSDPSEGARLGPGEVLVATATDPGWTPLFPAAGALVMEVGGVVSHGAIVAREFGLPAVVGVPGATRLLRDGDLVRVDGARGTVHLLAG